MSFFVNDLIITLASGKDLFGQVLCYPIKHIGRLSYPSYFLCIVLILVAISFIKNKSQLTGNGVYVV